LERTLLAEREEPAYEGRDGEVSDRRLVAKQECAVVLGEERLDLFDAREERRCSVGLALVEDLTVGSVDDVLVAVRTGCQSSNGQKRGERDRSNKRTAEQSSGQILV
jgi:hypothetical protein